MSHDTEHPRIVVVGSSNTDMVIRTAHLPRPGETILGGEFQSVPGGKGANQAVAAARAGGQVTFVACVGNDSLGTESIANFQRDGIDVSHVTQTPSAASGVALIMVSEAGENCIAVASGANALLTPADIERARPAIREAKVLLVQLETPLETVQAAVRIAGEERVPVILNPAPAAILSDELLRGVSLLTPNETEAEILTGIPETEQASAEQAARTLLQRGVKGVIVTLGSKGALLATHERMELIPTRAVQAVDTTAAGDVFNGALAVALAEGKPLPDAVRFANAAASISVTRHGAQPSAPRRDEIEGLMPQQPSQSWPCRPGSAKHIPHGMSPDFDEPLEDFKEDTE
ncbi:MAG: ribokinase [Planctomycetales bacterium]